MPLAINDPKSPLDLSMHRSLSPITTEIRTPAEALETQFHPNGNWLRELRELLREGAQEFLYTFTAFQKLFCLARASPSMDRLSTLVHYPRRDHVRSVLQYDAANWNHRLPRCSCRRRHDDGGWAGACPALDGSELRGWLLVGAADQHTSR
jgi:hypothetical protein